MQLSNNFSLEELTASGKARELGIANQPGPAELEALRALCNAVLQPLRDQLGQGINVTSAFRGPELNRAVNGVGKSQHLTGEAADLQAPGMTVADLFKAVIRFKLPFDQLIYEDKGASRWVHVSHVAAGPNRGQMMLAKFGPAGPVYSTLSEAQAMEITERVSRSGAADEPGYEEGADEPHDQMVEAPVVAAAPAALVPVEAAPAAAGVAGVVPPVSAPAAPAAKKPRRAKASPGKPAGKKAAPKKAAAKKAAAKKQAAKKPPAKTATSKTATSKTATAKKAPSKKVAAKKAAAKRPTATPAKKVAKAAAKPAKKAVAKKVAVKKAAPKKAASWKVGSKKAAAKKTAPRNAPTQAASKKAAAKKGPAKKAPAKKPAARKAATRKR